MVIDTAQAVDQNRNRTGIWCPNTEATQKITTTNATTAFSKDQIVRIVCDADSHIEFKAAASAGTSDMFMPENHVEYFYVKSGDKIGVVGGNMYVTPVEAL